MRVPTAKEYIEAARNLYETEGETEIDHLDETDEQAELRVSRSEDNSGEIGAYVKAWVFVPREDVQPKWKPNGRF